jgi:hypothetical protein
MRTLYQVFLLKWSADYARRRIQTIFIPTEAMGELTSRGLLISRMQRNYQVVIIHTTRFPRNAEGRQRKPESWACYGHGSQSISFEIQLIQWRKAGRKNFM